MCECFALHIIEVESLEKILKNIDVARVCRIDNISAKCHVDCAPIIAIHLANIINFLMKLGTFPSKCKTAKIKLFFEK